MDHSKTKQTFSFWISFEIVRIRLSNVFWPFEYLVGLSDPTVLLLSIQTYQKSKTKKKSNVAPVAVVVVGHIHGTVVAETVEGEQLKLNDFS